MIKNFTAVILLLLSFNVKGQNINIPDANFKKALVDNRQINRNGDGEISESEAEAFNNSLYLDEQEISDLTGIEYFINITLLYCGNNKLTRLDLSNNTAIQYLSCDKNQLTSLDISKNTGIRELRCDNNQIKNLDLNNNTKIRLLICNDNLLTSLNLSNNTKIEILECHRNNLRSLNLSTNTAITELFCLNNQLTSLDISQNTAITSLNCSNNKLTSLDINQNTAISRLWCFNNQLGSLDLSNNTAIEILKCYQNKLTSLNFNTNTAITDIDCSYNLLTNLDLSNNTRLINLGCAQNQLTNLVLCKKNTSLTKLACGNNKLAKLDVNNKYNLSILYCNENCFPFSELNLIQKSYYKYSGRNLKYASDKKLYSQLKGEIGYSVDYSNETEYNGQQTIFKWFNYDNNEIGSDVIKETSKGIFQFLKNGLYHCKMTNPHFPGALLKTENINIGNIPPKKFINIPDAKFKRILLDNLAININDDDEITESEAAAFSGKMIISNERISDLTGIEFFTNITILGCSDNLLTSLDVSNNTALKELWCNRNQLTSLDVRNNSALITLACEQNELTSLDVRNNTALTNLYCGKNKLTSLDISKNTAIDHLNCIQNQLTSLDISKNTAMSALECFDNQLTNLDTSKNTEMNYVNCIKNQLTSLDLSKNTAISVLFCSENKLTNLDVSNNTAISELGCSDNRLTSLDLSKNTTISVLWCSNNQLISLDLSKNTAISVLWCSNNRLKSLDLSKNKVIKRLNSHDNYFPLSQLNQIKTYFPSLDYTSTKNIFSPLVKGTNFIVDYSEESEFNGQLTAFKWHNTEGYEVGSDVVSETDNGKFQFLKPGMYYCEMTNQHFPDAILTTETISISSKEKQSITFQHVPSDVKVNDVLSLNATASSELDIIFELVSGNASISGNEITFTQMGLVEVKAIQAGNEEFMEVEKTIRIKVNKREQNITFENTPSETKVNDVLSLSAYASSELDLIFKVVSGVAYIIGHEITFKQAGIVEVKAIQAGNNEFAATEKTIQFKVSKREQLITFLNAPENAKLNDVLSLNATASSGLGLIYEIVSGEASISGHEITFKQVGLVVIKAIQAGNNEFMPTEKTIQINIKSTENSNKISQEITFQNAPNELKVNDVVDLNATASSGLKVSFELVSGNASINDNELTCTKSGIIKVKAIQGGNDEYEATEAIIEITASKKDQTITFENIPTTVEMTDILELKATANSGLELHFEIILGDANLNGNTISFNEVGTVTIKAIQEGNYEFEACEKTIKIQVGVATGIEDVLESSTQIYPNPVVSEMVIKFESNEERTIRIFDLQGRLKLQKEAVSSTERLNLADFKSGMYLMKIQAESGSFTYKILKK